MLLTLVEPENGGVSGPSAVALAAARELATREAATLEAVMFAPPHGITDRLAAHGVSTLHVIADAMCAGYAPECRGEALARLLRELAPDGVLAAATDRGNELMAQLAARAGLPLATNCVALSGGGVWTLTRQRAGGVLLEDAELDAPAKLVTVAPGAEVSLQAAPVPDVAVRTFAPGLDDTLVHSALVGVEAKESGVSLATAPVVVSGGRGVGSAEGFAPLEELAKVLGGAVGCSRVVTNNGWRPHSDQVGLTGTKVAPALYIACGISGASQHWVGCMDAKKILAVNTDPEAPMVTRAGYAVIGDVKEVLDAVLAEIRNRQAA